MIKLKIFGTPQLVDTDQYTALKTETFPLLMAIYVVVEHQGKVKSEKLRQIFFPMAPVCPKNFCENSKVIYEKLWEKVIDEKPPEGRKFNLNCDKKGKKTAIVSLHRNYFIQNKNSEIESACRQLQRFGVIEDHRIQGDVLDCWLDSKFGNYLCGVFIKYRGDSNSPKVIIGKRYDTATDKIKKFDSRMILKKSSIDLIIPLDSQITDLEKALAEKDFNKIKTIYRQPFLSGVKSNTWLSPEVCYWIQTKRQYFAEQVSKTLLEIIEDCKQPIDQILLIKDIQAFCEQCELNDESLQQEIDKCLASSNSKDTLENIKTNISKPLPLELTYDYPENPRFYNHIRPHLLAKTDENCHNQLKTIEQRIIDTHISIKTLRGDLEESFLLRDSHRFSQILFGPSYGFMVLLGEPGIGKSLALYYFAKQLIEQTKEDVKKPIPLIFHLANWAMQPLSFEEWLKLELIQLGLGEKNINADFQSLLTYGRCIFLLDGFDNLPPQQRLSHLKTIDGFIQIHGEPDLGGVIIASRSDEYRLAREQLLEDSATYHFYAEATIQALSDKEIRTSFEICEISIWNGALGLPLFS